MNSISFNIITAFQQRITFESLGHENCHAYLSASKPAGNHSMLLVCFSFHLIFYIPHTSPHSSPSLPPGGCLTSGLDSLASESTRAVALTE